MTRPAGDAMSLDRAIAEALRPVIREELEALRRELAQLRPEHGQVVSVAEAARRLSVSPRTVQRMLARGELASVKLGGARRVRLDGVLPPARADE